MPTWTHTPPDDPRGYGLPIVRTPAGRSLKAIVTSSSLVGCDTHFWGGHTVPCERPDCNACENGVAYRWHGYLAAFNPNDQLHFVFEMTAQAAQKFLAYFKENKTLRCCQFEAYRWKHTRNGRVIIRCEQSAIAPGALPNEPDLEQVMAVIWRLPRPNVETRGIERNAPRIYANSHGDGTTPDPRKYEIPQP